MTWKCADFAVTIAPVGEARWRAARLDEIETAPTLRGPGYWRDWTDEEDFAQGWRSIRRHFGIRGFGVNAHEAAAGRELVVAHDELEFGDQEELYVILRGRARFTCDDAELELGEGAVLYAPPDVKRRAVALETPTVVLMIGGTPGEPYLTPDWDA
jgi:mannose-6-phosphate isomerase-like protein (cupin superfamily)